MSEYLPYLESIFHCMAVLFSSDFMLALLAAAAGAYFGAIGAQQISDKRRKQDLLLSEVREINAAIAISATICNQALVCKKQLTAPLLQQFLKDKELVVDALSKTPRGTVPSVSLDMNTFSAPALPIKELTGLMFDRITCTGKELSALSMLNQSFDYFEKAIARRDALIERFRTGQVPKALHAQYYFGQPLPENVVSNEVEDIYKIFNDCADDLAYFSSIICDELISLGHKKHVKLKKFMGENVPKITTFDLSPAKASGIFPNENNYSDWERGFAKEA